MRSLPIGRVSPLALTLLLACGGGDGGVGDGGGDSGPNLGDGDGGGDLDPACAAAQAWLEGCSDPAAPQLAESCTVQLETVDSACGSSRAAAWASATETLYQCYADAGWCPADPADGPAWDATLACNSRFEEQAGELRDACLGEEDDDPDPDPANCAPTEPLTHRAPELLANLLVLDDDAVVALDTDFSAPWFGATTGPPSVSANGLLLFGSAVDGCCEGGGLPRPDGVDGIVALAWTDLDPSRGGTVSWQVDGDPGSRQLRVSFLGVPAYTDGGEVSVEAVVYEADGAVDLHIGSLRSFDRTTLGAESLDGQAATCEAGWVGAILDLGAVSLRLPPQEAGR